MRSHCNYYIQNKRKLAGKLWEGNQRVSVCKLDFISSICHVKLEIKCYHFDKCVKWEKMRFVLKLFDVHMLNRRWCQSMSSLKVACNTLHQLESKASAKLYMTVSGIYLQYSTLCIRVNPACVKFNKSSFVWICYAIFRVDTVSLYDIL
jgi:hypothetical protein